MRSYLRKIVHILIVKAGKIVLFRKKYEKKLLIIRTDGIGDFILFTPSIEYIKNYYSDFEIEILVRDYVGPLAKTCPHFNQVTTFNKKKFRINIFYKLLTLFKIYKSKYKVCLNPMYSRDWLSDELTIWSGAKKRIGWNFSPNTFEEFELKISKDIYNKFVEGSFSFQTHELERNKYFLQHLDININDFKPKLWINTKSEFVENLWKKFKLSEKIVIAVIPDNMSNYNGWDFKKFNDLLTKLNSKINNIFFLIAGVKNEKLFQNFKELKNIPFLNIIGMTNLFELYDIICRVNLVLGYDSGPVHMAITAGVNSVCILGGGHFSRFLPYGDPDKHKYAYVTMPCYNCEWNCIYNSTKCIDDITVDAVETAILELVIPKNRSF